MKDLVLYLHGKGGSAEESEHYKPLFPGCQVLGLDYRGAVPWEAGPEIRAAVEKLKTEYDSIRLVANSIGAYFGMHAGIGELIERAWFISPIVDMEKLILDMLGWAGATEEELQAKGEIPTAFGETLSRAYLSYVREHPIRWDAPTRILYGSGDELTSLDTVTAFAQAHSAELTVMEGGEHWFHTPAQMAFLDAWILQGEKSPLLETARLRLYPASREQMEAAIASERDEDLRGAYGEMLEYALARPEQWAWYAMWRIEGKDGEPVGDLCFKGLDANGRAEIGYGIRKEHQGRGYAAEAVQAAVAWAFRDPAVTALEAETGEDNRASRRVLEKCGFLPDGTVGEEGPRFVRRRTE